MESTISEMFRKANLLMKKYKKKPVNIGLVLRAHHKKTYMNRAT